MKIVLIGFASSGKSTVGAMLAQQLNTHFYDSDLMVEQVANMSVAQIFSQHGEEYFRNLENEVLQRLSQVDNAVVALGGGSVLCKDFATLARNSTVVWLQVSVASVADRLNGDLSRPLFDGLTEQALAKLMDKRVRYYKAAANFAVTTDGQTPAQVAQQVLSLLQ